MKTGIVIFLALLLLCSCNANSPVIENPQQLIDTSTEKDESVEGIVPDSETTTPNTVAQETEVPDTDAVIESGTAEVPAETEPVPAETEDPVETVLPVVTEPLEPPILPDDLHTNITDPEAAFILADIYDTVSEYDTVSIYFTDVEKEYWFGIGEENRYHTASTVKPVYAQYLLSSGVDMEAKITLQNVSRTSSTGKLTWKESGNTFTVGELIEYSIRYSDNQAHRLLYETFGIEGYNKYVANFGSGGLPMDEEYEWSRVTPKKLSTVMLEIYRYDEMDDTLLEHLKNTDYNKQIPAGTRYETAHKYGSNGGTDGYHDTAIVYAPERAYVLTIMTNIDTSQTEDEDAVFRKAAELCDDLHAVLFKQ